MMQELEQEKSPRRKRDGVAMYTRIAYDIANRIATGDIPEGKRLSGRSLMSSEYGVSPETIRRAFSLLEEMHVVQVLQNSGVLVQSREHAVKFLAKQGNRSETRDLLARLKHLIDMHEEIEKELFDVVKKLIHASERFVASNPFFTFETSVADDASVIGSTLSDLNFWHQTKATVIAVRREGRIILSPGPEWTLAAQDVLVLVGDQETRPAVELLVR